MSLKSIVRVVGGDLYDGGRRANIPAPGHGPRDRSVSLLLDGGRVVVHAFGATIFLAVQTGDYVNGSTLAVDGGIVSVANGT